jgi:CubicO group peptidase (beta-lactamase class C family)
MLAQGKMYPHNSNKEEGRAMDLGAFEKAMADADLPGVTCAIVNRDGTLYENHFGWADAPNQRPMKLDTPCQIASMTKALVSVGAMQLVERGILELDAPVDKLLPELASPRVLTGFAKDGSPHTRAAVRPITLRHLLTHTAGLGYFFVHPEILEYFVHTGMPEPGAKAGIEMPLLFDPGDRWEYSVATDWVGLAIEAATGEKLRHYIAKNLFDPLGMRATAFLDSPAPDAASIHRRKPGGGFAAEPMFLGGGEFDAGGSGLTSTAPDYAKFLRAILRGGELDGKRVLSKESVAEMSRNQIGNLRAGYLNSTMPDFARQFDNFPDQHTGWGLGFLINPERGPAGRSPNSLSWAGIFNSYYWIDPSEGIAGVLIAQLSPFGDPDALDAFAALERAAYS